MRAILTEPKNSIIKQYIKLLAMDGIALSFDEEALEYIVDKAIEFKLGARGLRSIVETVMSDIMFDAPGSDTKEIRITLDYARRQIGKANPASLQSV